MGHDEARFGKLWTEWDARIERGESPAEILKDSKDEDLVEVLGGESVHDRKYARDIIATELLNRLHSRATKHPPAAKAAEASAKLAHDAAQEGQAAIHGAEKLLKSSGQEEFGDSVSKTAYASLDASKAAHESAREHADSLHQTLGQSRAGGDLARDAADAAQAGSDLTETLQQQMKSIGRSKEGQAASAAGQKIKLTADKAAKDAGAAHDEKRNRDSSEAR